MAVYKFGSEGSDFSKTLGMSNVTTDDYVTTSGYYRSAYSRAAFAVTSGSGATRYAGYVMPFGGNYSAFWFRFVMAVTHASDFMGDNGPLNFYDAGGVLRLQIRIDSGPIIYIYKANSANSFTLLAQAAIPTFAIATPRIFAVQVDYSSSGSVKIYAEDVSTPVCQYSGDVTTDGATSLASVTMTCARWNNFTAKPIHFSEVIFSDQSLLGASLITLPITGAGASNTAASGTYADIDDTTTNDTDVVTMDTAGQKILMALDVSKMAAASGLAVIGVGVGARCSRGGTGPQTYKVRARYSTSEGSSTGVTPDTALGGVSDIVTINPATGASFTVAEVSSGNLQLGIEVAA